jgi:septal ring factor EnvC (AmiA/AmiB activator)
MPDKPAAQLIRELSVQVAEAMSTSRAWADYGQKDIERVEAANTKTADALKEVEKKLAAIEERLNEIKRVTDETGRRRFTLFQGIVCVFLGGVLTFLFQIAVTYIRSRIGQGP